VRNVISATYYILLYGSHIFILQNFIIITLVHDLLKDLLKWFIMENKSFWSIHKGWHFLWKTGWAYGELNGYVKIIPLFFI
jgi:hypothetical protein